MSQEKAVVALFSGCGGLDLGFHKAGFNVVWASEDVLKVGGFCKKAHRVKLRLKTSAPCEQ